MSLRMGISEALLAFLLSKLPIDEINRIIAEAVATAKAKEETQRAGGMVLNDNPIASLKSWIVLDDRSPRDDVPPGQENFFLLEQISGGRLRQHRAHLTVGETTYLSSRRTWSAFAPVRALVVKALQAVSFDQVEGRSVEALAHELMPILFDGRFCYGVGTVVLHEEEGVGHVLMGVRAKALGGVNVGTASVPAGLVKPGQSLSDAARHELLTETGLVADAVHPGFAYANHQDAASTTFVRLSILTAGRRDVKPSYEWERGTLVWVPRNALIAAIKDPTDNKRLVAPFRAAGLSVADDLRVAPDIAGPALALLTDYGAPR